MVGMVEEENRRKILDFSECQQRDDILAIDVKNNHVVTPRKPSQLPYPFQDSADVAIDVVKTPAAAGDRRRQIFRYGTAMLRQSDGVGSVPIGGDPAADHSGQAAGVVRMGTHVQYILARGFCALT